MLALPRAAARLRRLPPLAVAARAMSSSHVGQPAAPMPSSDSFRREHESRMGRGGAMWAVPVVTLGLCAWQMYRLGWKNDLVAQAEQRIDLPPTQLTSVDAAATNAASAQFTHVVATGEFLHDREMLVGPRTFIQDSSEEAGGGLFSSGRAIGYTVITPFRLADGAVILVNRGWVPLDLAKNPARNSLALGVVTIDGIIRDGEPVSSMQEWSAPTRPESGVWHAINLPKMAEWTGALPLIVQMQLDSQINSQLMGDNQPLLPRVHAKLRNNHLQYALTWFGISAGTTLILLSRSGRLRFK